MLFRVLFCLQASVARVEPCYRVGQAHPEFSWRMLKQLKDMQS